MVFDIYSERTKRTRLLQIEQYHEIPEPLRNQIFSIISDRIIEFSEWESLWHAFCDEKGKNQQEKSVSYDYQYDYEAAMAEYQSRCRKQIEEGAIEDIFDVVDIAFQITDKNIGNRRMSQEDLQNKVESYRQAIEDINKRFERAGVGYRLVNNRIERKILHLDLALPALDLLRDEVFKNTRDNFNLAHRSYQNGNYGECVSNAGKSFESLLKALCKHENLKHDTNEQIGDLVKILCESLFSSGKFNKKFSQSFKFLSDVRAHFGGHGSAPQEETPDFMARYALHLAATNILFFMQAVEAKNEPIETENALSSTKSSPDETSDNNPSSLPDDIPF